MDWESSPDFPIFQYIRQSGTKGRIHNIIPEFIIILWKQEGWPFHSVQPGRAPDGFISQRLSLSIMRRFQYTLGFFPPFFPSRYAFERA